MTIDPMQMATEIVREHYGVPATIKAITGLNAFVLRLRFDDRPPRILKMAKSSSASSLRTELAVIEVLRTAGIPVADIEFVDYAAPLPYVIFLSAGETTVMDQLAGSATAGSFVEGMASWLARIHAVSPPTEILPNSPGTTLDELHQLADAIAGAGILTQEEVGSFKCLPMPDVAGTSLCHGDFHTVHCVVDAGRISAVVDWETAWMGNPFVDLAVTISYFDYYAPGLASTFLEAYGRERPLPSGFEPTYLPVRMAHTLGLIRVFNLQQRAANVARGVALFRSYLHR